MDFTAEWKSLWPISSAFSPPLLRPNKNPETPIGPLIFTPNLKSQTTTLLHSPSLSPCLPPPYPSLSFPRFLQNYSSIPSSISSVLGRQLPEYSSHFHSFNSLQLLRVPDKDLVIMFFPTGENSDCVGFSKLEVKDGILSAQSLRGNFFQVAKDGCTNRQRITWLSVNPFNDDDGFYDASIVKKCNNNNNIRIGFLMVCTDYSVYWYGVKISSFSTEGDVSVYLDYVGCADAKMLKGYLVVSASWNPHLGEECLVLLQNGDFMLFDVNSSSEHKSKLMCLVRGTNTSIRRKMHIYLPDKVRLEEGDCGEEGGWFGCKFSWHPRIFIVSHCNAVFLVDSRANGECKICCLLKLENLSLVKNDGFLSLSIAGSDGFYFSVATSRLLILCDVRKPLMPVLRWAHNIQNPRYMTIFTLSKLRANAEDNKYQSSSKSGYCILLGSFWDGNFSIFCYGPDFSENGSVSSEISKLCKSYYAWGLPSKFPLCSWDCTCGSCLVRDDFSKESLPVWIDWRQKKHLVLGFDILDTDLFERVYTPKDYGGFILVRLMSSGKIETQQFDATWESFKISEVGHKRKSFDWEDNYLYSKKESEYDGEKKFQHMKLGYFNSYLKNNLAEHILERTEKMGDIHLKNQVKSNSNFHQEICSKLKAFGFPKVRSSLTVSDILKDIYLPTSIHEVALRSIWASLPTNLLQLAFRIYSDFHEDCKNENEPLEFLTIPDQLQLPPFPFRKPSSRSNKWSSKNPPYETLIGPILPPHFLTTLHKLRVEEEKQQKELYIEETEEFSVLSQFKCKHDEVMEVVDKHILDYDTKTQDNDFVSLSDDTDNIGFGSKKLKFLYHKPSAFLENPVDLSIKRFGYENKIFSTHVVRSQEPVSELSMEMTGQELFDVGSAIELKFDDLAIEFSPEELEAYRALKKQELAFQKSYKPYQDYLAGDSKLK